MLVYSGPVVRDAILDQAKAMGVDVIRVQFVWRNIALSKPKNPADPASYGNAWANWDSLVLEAHKRGMKVLATITGPAPSWAAGTTDKYYSGSRYPNARQFGEFVAAVGRRYSGSAKASATAAQAGLIGDLQCTPIPPLISCDPGGNPVIGRRRLTTGAEEVRRHRHRRPRAAAISRRHRRRDPAPRPRRLRPARRCRASTCGRSTTSRTTRSSSRRSAARACSPRRASTASCTWPAGAHWRSPATSATRS